MQKILTGIDSFNEWLGRIFGWLLIPLTLITVFDVTMRYVFNKPTIWAWDLNVIIQGAIVVFGGGYALLHKGHVSVDILVSGLSDRKRAALDAFTDLLIIIGVSLLMWKVFGNAVYSVSINEHYTSTWQPIVYPLKVGMAVGVFAMLLQAIAKWIRDLLVVFGANKEVA